MKEGDGRTKEYREERRKKAKKFCRDVSQQTASLAVCTTVAVIIEFR
jgi:hypothetical protein